MNKMFKMLKIIPNKIFVYNSNEITFKEISKPISRRIGIIGIIIIFLSLIIGFSVGKTFSKEIVVEIPLTLNLETKYDMAIGDVQWKDSIFKIYDEQAHLYLSQKNFEDTPINSDMLSLAARNTYDSTGIIVPLELALAQAQWESGMGKTGASPDKNPYNIGEYDTGTIKYFYSTYEGIEAYYMTMASDYLSCKSLDELFYNFTNCAGSRYASSETYEGAIKYQYFFIQQWLVENHKSE